MSESFLSVCVKTNLVPTTVVKVVMSGESSGDIDSQLVRLADHLVHIIDINCSGLLGGFVNQKVGVVVLADGNGDYLHGSISSGGEVTKASKHGLCLAATASSD